MSDLSQLGSTDPREFDAALVPLRRETVTIDLLVRVVEILARSAVGRREQDRRLRIVLEAWGTQVSEDTAVNAAHELVARGLPIPQELQRRLKRVIISGPVSMAAAVAPSVVSVSGTARGSAEVSGELARVRGRSGPVLLLGSESEHAANRALLENDGFTASRIERSDLLLDFLEEPLCGIAVGASWWRLFEPSKQRAELGRLCGASTIPWMRIDVSGLEPTVEAELEAIVREVCGGERPASLLCHGRGVDITNADLTAIRRVADILSASESVGFHPEELSSEEARLLRAVVLSHLRDQWGRVPEFDTMRIRFLKGSYSGARVAMVAPDDGGVPLVVKFGALTRLRDETSRNHGVQRWNGGVAPSLHFHGNAALLVFALVEGPKGGPAPTLGEQIDKVVYMELARDPAMAASVSDLNECVSSALDKLSRLNKLRPATHEENCKWLREAVGPIARGEVRLPVHDPSTGADVDVGPVVHRAAELVAELDGRGTAHGDVHLGNVLVLGPVPVFVDFATAGPGHPLHDIVRLDTQIWFRAFRMMAPERDVALLLRGVLADGDTLDGLRRRWGDVLAFGSNQVCVRSTIETRRVGMGIVGAHGGGLRHLLAMYLTTAAQSMLAGPACSPLARAFIAGLAAHIH